MSPRAVGIRGYYVFPMSQCLVPKWHFFIQMNNEWIYNFLSEIGAGTREHDMTEYESISSSNSAAT